MSLDYTLKPSGSTEALTIDYEAELNEAQYEAVTAPPGPILVIAGAGSGKTRTLTYRVAYLVEKGIPPHRILLLTFTNKASKEMLRRVGDLLSHDISKLWGGTFHHVGHRLLRRHAELVGLQPGFNIMDRDDATDLVVACFEEAGIDPKDKSFPKGDVLIEVFSQSCNTVKTIAQVLEEKYPYFLELQELILKLENIYQRRKKDANVVDYDDLLVLTLRLLKEHDDLRERYQTQFQHILVDEFQDTNRTQAEIVDLLAAEHHQVMVVGDDAQSIYSWRGANFANIMEFPDRHPGTKIIKIETNYRSTPEILNLANASIDNNSQQFPKILQASRKGGVKPALISLGDCRQQAMFVAQRILELHEQGHDLSQMVVLYRSHFHSMEVQMELTKRNIPFQITSGLRFFEQAHIKDIAAYLRTAVNERDEISFKRIARMMPGVGPSSAHKLWNQIHDGKEWDAVKAPAKAKAAWRQWSETHRQLKDALKEGQGPDALVQLVIDALYDDYLKSKYTNYQSRMEDIEQLRGFAESFDDCYDFLGQLSLLTNIDVDGATRYQEEDAIRLTTIHQAKGLEWNIVFIVMLCEGMFPSSRSLETMEGEEEERRLFYVAATRAKDELYMIYPKLAGFSRYQDAYQKPSRFLSEFPEEYCHSWKIRTEPSWG